MSSTPRITENLKRKQSSLNTVVQPWLGQNHENPNFPRMSSQTSAAVNLLRGVLEGIEAEITSGKLAPSTIEHRILGGYQFWNVFQSKFAQRLQKDLERFLKAADELAWLAYLPARNVAPGGEEQRKEPPLVYFSDEASPFVDGRGQRFQPAGIPAYLIESYGWPAASRRLPFAMIGVPWFQLGFLPGALAIAHEVGHSVEDDFALGEPLKALITAAAPQRASTWNSWTGEMFADLWACLALGPAFVHALADTLWLQYQLDPSAQSKEYPPPPLRIWWNIEVLHQNGYETSLTGIWPDVAKFDAQSDLGVDAKQIAKQWLTHSFAEFGNRTLPAVLNFDAVQQETAKSQAASAKANKADQNSDVRALWSAIRVRLAATGHRTAPGPDRSRLQLGGAKKSDGLGL